MYVFKSRIIYLLLGLVIANSSILSAQSTVSFSGNATDNTGEVIDFADIVLLLEQDSSVYKFSFIEEGEFNIDQVLPRKYIVYVNSLNCEPYYKAVDVRESTQVELVLSRSGISLDQVTISSRRKIFDNKDGNITFNIENTILKAEPNPISILSKLPYVQLSPDGQSISIVGRGSPLIYMNNQRIDLDRLNNISVDDIISIEIINNPSAKYEGEGRSLILVKTKKNIQEGYKVDISETLSQREFLNNFLGLNSSVKAGKSELKLNLGFNTLQPWEKLAAEYEILNDNLYSNSQVVSTSDRQEYILAGGFYLPINDHDYFSADYNTKLMRTIGDINGQSEYSLGSTPKEIATHTENQDKRDYHNAIVNYNKGLDQGNLFIGGQYATFRQSLITYIENSFDQNAFQAEQDRDQNFGTASFSARVDYERSFSTGGKVEIGLNSVISKSKSLQLITPADMQELETETDYEYDEQIHAAYTQLSRSIGAINLSGGIRLEQAYVEGRFRNSSSNLVERNNLYLLPKAQLSLPLDSLTTLTINYARNITRPNFSNLNQIEVYINPFLLFSRNINLRPTLTQELAANFQRSKNSLRLSFMYQRDPVNWSASYLESLGVFKTTPINFERMLSFSAAVNVPLTHKNWTSFNTLSAHLNNLVDENASQLQSLPYLYFYTNHNFKLPREFSFNFNAWGFTKRREGAYQRNALVIAGIGISRVFFDNLYCTFNFNNLLNNRVFEEVSSVNQVESFNGFFVDNRELSFSLKYSFGKIKSKYKNRDVNDSNRVR